MSPLEQRSALVKHLSETAARNLLVIVEGKNDKAALEKLGVRRVALLDVHYKTVEKAIGEREVALLVDLDRHGRTLYHRLHHDLTRHGVRVDNHLREFLLKETPLRQIEGLYSYFCRLGSRDGRLPHRTAKMVAQQAALG